MYERALDLPASGTETFFLWGPRQAGKSTLLKHQYADGLWIDLLKADEFRRYVANPEAHGRRDRHLARGVFVQMLWGGHLA